MYDFLARGLLGNTMRSWHDPWKMLEDCYDVGVEITVRGVGKPGLPYLHHLPPCSAYMYGIFLQGKYGCYSFYQESPPDQHLIFQGEIAYFDGCYALEYSREKASMKDGLRKERITETSFRIPWIIRMTFDPASLSDLEDLLRIYPGHVVEFSCYEVEVGVLKGRRVIFWEVRKY